MYDYRTDIIMQIIKIYNSSYMKERGDEDSCSEKYKLAVSKDRAEVVWIDRDVSNTFFSQIKILSVYKNIRFGF